MKKLSLLIGCFSFILLKAEQPKEAFNNEQLSITYANSDCHDNPNGIHQVKILLTFQNKSNQTIEVKFNRSVWYNDVLAKNEGDAAQFTVVLKPNEQLAGECNTKNKALYVFSKHLDLKGRQLTKFALNNVSINKTDK